MSGPKNNILVGWKALRGGGIHIEPEQRIGDKGAVYLGCRHIVTSLKLASGRVVTTMTYDMEDSLGRVSNDIKVSLDQSHLFAITLLLSYQRTTKLLQL
ncbi:MAG: hypothetical protein ACKPKO_01305, partial [Candidatus Fonsibacter sp.]